MEGLTERTINVYGRIKKLGSFRNGCYKRVNMVSGNNSTIPFLIVYRITLHFSNSSLVKD